MSYYFRLNTILKEINKLKDKQCTPNLFEMLKDVGDDYYRVSDVMTPNSNNLIFGTLSDEELKELKFKDESELDNYINNRAYMLGISKAKVQRFKPLLIEIVDNSHLESVLWSANK